MTCEQIEFVLEASNIRLYVDIFSKLTSKQLLYGLSKLSEDKFWLSLKSVAFRRLVYFIEGTKISHKDIFINKILDIANVNNILTKLVPQYQVMCFTYRETFEYIIENWINIPSYLHTLILEIVDCKRLIQISEKCTIDEWESLCEHMEGSQIIQLSHAIVDLTTLSTGDNETCNLLHFCKVFDKFYELNHIFTILNNE